ncbi:MAG: NADH:quinone oxidoreductase, partial [Paracoccaceae bacterium]
RKPVAKNGKPPVIRKARADGADDLKVIKGVGPALEKTLNDLGFYHYDQIAGWRKKEIEWVDERLRFKGRIERDGWIKQCKSLAKKA